VWVVPAIHAVWLPPNHVHRSGNHCRKTRGCSALRRH
jgi:hypothetical protein